MRYFQMFVEPRYRPTFPLTQKGAKEAVELVNLQNGKRDIYRTVYNYQDEVDGDNAIIDKVYIDFDPDEEGKSAISNARILADYLETNNIRHAVYFSGRGCHVYIYTTPVLASDLNNAPLAIRSYVKKLANELKITPDWHVVGDVSRISRLPGTVNRRTNLYCIPLTPDELQLSRKEIEKLAEHSRSDVNPISGERRLDLREYDHDYLVGIDLDMKSDLDFLGEAPTGLPSCVNVALQCGKPGYQERFIIITALRDLAFSKRDAEEILRQNLCAEKFEHCVDEEGQLDYLYQRHDLLFPSCKTIQMSGLCVKGCSGCDIYY